MTQQIIDPNRSVSPPARSETVEVSVSEVSVCADFTQTIGNRPDTEKLSLERCIEIYRRTRRCDHYHFEFQYPHGCGVELKSCRVCGRNLEKKPI